jgi:hypothetical protein
MRKSLLMGLANDKTKKRGGGREASEAIEESDFPYDFLSFSEMRNVLDLLTLYIQVN